MLREQIALLIKKSIKEQIALDDYSTIYYKIRIANNYTEGGIFRSTDHEPNTEYMMKYLDRMEFFRIYNEALLTDERFNIIEIHFDLQMNPNAVFTWDQTYYDADLEGNKKLKKNHDAVS
jgi:hypothetical protein